VLGKPDLSGLQRQNNVYIGSLPFCTSLSYTDCSYRDEYAKLTSIGDSSSAPAEDSVSELPHRASEFLAWKYGNCTSTLASDELDRYLKADIELVYDLDVPKWWIQHRHEFPLLFSIAVDILAIPAMSTAVERSFSTYLAIRYYF
jgi:hypothetical protein